MNNSEANDLLTILETIKNCFKNENIRFTLHALDEMAEEDIETNDIIDAVASGQILENYPEHLRGACCLIGGLTQRGRNIHIVCTTTLQPVIIITVYEPKPPKWITPTQRRQIK